MSRISPKSVRERWVRALNCKSAKGFRAPKKAQGPQKGFSGPKRGRGPRRGRDPKGKKNSEFAKSSGTRTRTILTNRSASLHGS